MTRAPARRGRADHLAARVPHGGQAHLGQEVVIVLVEDDELGARGGQLVLVLADALGQHRIE